MKKVKILCDSVCDVLDFDGQFGPDLFGFDYLPLYVRFDKEKEVAKDYKEIRPEKLFEKVKKYNQIPKTTCPSPDDYYQFFKKYIDVDYDVIFLSIGSGFSGGFKSASLAAEEFEENRVRVIDSKNISTGIGILVIKACNLVKEGKSSEEIATILNSLIDKSKCKFVVDTMEYLYKGGRCSALKALVGSLLNLKPVIKSEHGKLSVYQTTIGKRLGLKSLLNAFKKDFDKDAVDLEYVIVTHCVTEEEKQYLIDKLIEMGVDKNVIHFSNANCTVATHCGPKCIGIIYLIK